MKTHTAALFPGQGAYLPGALAEVVRASGDVRGVLERIDDVIREYDGDPALPVLREPEGPSIEDLAESPGRLSLVIFATSIGLFEFMRREGIGFDLLIGHSVGEIAALTVAGSLSIEDAARLIWERDVALRTAELPAGGMVALSADSRRAGHFRDVVAKGSVAIAAYNAPRQTVLSGAEEGLAALERVAGALEMGSRRLAVPYPYHNPMLGGASRRFGEILAEIETKAPESRVYSPILGREVADGRDARELLARHLTDPVRFLQAVRDVHASGVDAFVECGARGALTGLVEHSLPADVRTVAPLARRAGPEEILAALDFITDGKAERPKEQPKTERPEAGPPKQEPQAEESPRADRPEPEQPQAETTREAEQPEAENKSEADASRPGTGSPDGTDDDLFAELQRLYAEVVGYPPEVFTENAQLEAELGIDSLRQTRLLAKVADKYDVPGPESGGRLSDYPTLGHIADAVREARST